MHEDEEKLHPKESALRERRTNEAIMKDYMGPTGKFGVILRFLGTPIIRQGSPSHSENYLYDHYAPPQEDAIPTFSEEDDYIEDGVTIPYTGYLFDGLSRGMHLEIKYMTYEKKLTVDYKGYNVYKEIAGDLYAFAPFPEWENLINRLYVVAEKKLESATKIRREEMNREVKAKQKNLLQRLRTLWGL
jgi:hypothetical protein